MEEKLFELRPKFIKTKTLITAILAGIILNPFLSFIFLLIGVRLHEINSWFMLIGIFAPVISFIILFISVCFYDIHNTKNIHYNIYTDKIEIIKRGHNISIAMFNVLDVRLSQNFYQQLFKIGSISITINNLKNDIKIKDIDNYQLTYMKLKNIFDESKKNKYLNTENKHVINSDKIFEIKPKFNKKLVFDYLLLDFFLAFINTNQITIFLIRDLHYFKISDLFMLKGLLLLILTCSFLFISMLAIKYKSNTAYIIYNDRIEFIHGKKNTILWLKNIKTIILKKTFAQKMCGVGTIIFRKNIISYEEVRTSSLQYIENVDIVYAKLNELIAKQKTTT